MSATSFPTSLAYVPLGQLIISSGNGVGFTFVDSGTFRVQCDIPWYYSTSDSQDVANMTSVASGEIVTVNLITDPVTYYCKLAPLPANQTAQLKITYKVPNASAIYDGTVQLADLADLAQDKFIGRTSASTGVPQTATITAAARTVLDDTTVAAMRTTMGVDDAIAAAVASGAVTSGKLSQFAATTSAELAGVISDETGTGLVVFSASPTLTGTPLAPTAAPGTSTTQIASTAFVAAAVASLTGVLSLKGSTDCSTTPNYPAGVVGDMYYVTVAGKIGGASGKSVDIGDSYICKTINAGGTEGSVGTSWFVLEHNLVGALLASNNLSDVTAATALTNLGFSAFAQTLVPAANAAAARTTLGAGTVTSVFGQTATVTTPVAQVADSTATGGNARGANATDWQTNRATAAQVASATDSTVLGGKNNTSSGTQSISGGNGASATGTSSIALGRSVSAGGTDSMAAGGVSNSAAVASCGILAGESNTISGSGQLSGVIGSYKSAATHFAELVHGSGISGRGVGSGQYQQILVQKVTTDATQAELVSNVTSEQIIIPNGSGTAGHTWYFKARIVGRSSAATSVSSVWTIEGVIITNNTVGSTAILGTPTTTLIAQDAGAAAWAVAVSADNSNGALSFKVTGAGATTIRWFASVDIVNCSND